MLIPIGHDRPFRRVPWVTFTIMIACTLVQLCASQQTHERFAYATGSGFTLNLFASAFVHAGWWHLLGNMLFLFVAGTAIEDRWGPLKFFAFYLFGAAASQLCFDYFHHGDAVLCVGASGAIAALMGAFLVLFATARIRIFYFFLIVWGTVYRSAVLVLLLWLANQILSARVDHGSNIAYAAHIGGFAIGFALALLTRIVFPSDQRV